MKTQGSRIVACVSLTFVSLFRSAVSAGASDASVDVTAHVEMLGSPYQSKYPSGPRIYARNIWDLCVCDGELLIGAGNSHDRRRSMEGNAALPVQVLCEVLCIAG